MLYFQYGVVTYSITTTSSNQLGTSVAFYAKPKPGDSPILVTSKVNTAVLDFEGKIHEKDIHCNFIVNFISQNS